MAALFNQPTIDDNAQWRGIPAIALSNRFGTLTVARFGGHVLSYVPMGAAEVFWVSPIRGGVPICWPWFAKQNRPASDPQHAFARSIEWNVLNHFIHHDSSELVLAPKPMPGLQALGWQLDLRLEIRLDASLTMHLTTHNRGADAIRLTQAFHSYFAVSDVRNVQVSGLQELDYADKLENFAIKRQTNPFAFKDACDRIYYGLKEHYGLDLIDHKLARQLHIKTTGSRSTVVWNPGAVNVTQLADTPQPSWPDFLCIEVSNAEPDGVMLAVGAKHTLTQTVSVSATDV
jgi:glucose-6-phosphate 1-epimerase